MSRVSTQDKEVMDELVAAIVAYLQDPENVALLTELANAIDAVLNP